MATFSSLPSFKPRCVFVVGATATGKSALALELARRVEEWSSCPVEIINADSVQFYTEVQIGANKPSAKELAEIPHHLVGVVPPPDKWTAGDFRRHARSILFSSKDKIYLIVGGSGFYFRALEKGMYSVPEVAPELRLQIAAQLEQQGLEALYQELVQLDPETAREIAPQDTYRVMRALEINRQLLLNHQHDRDEVDKGTRPATLSELKRNFADQSDDELEIVKIGLNWPRELLREKIVERTHTMLKMGLVEEVERLRMQGLQEWAPMKSVGYLEVQQMLDAQMPLAELEYWITTHTYQLARRQQTWFARDNNIHWIDGHSDFNQILTKSMQILRR